MKRLFSLLLAFAMVLSLMPMGIQRAKAAEVAEGDGTSAQAPVFIDTEEEWVYYLNNTTGFAYKHETQHTWYFQLTADIVLDAADEENGDTVNGTVGYTSTGKTTVIDLNGFTVTANGGATRFMAANSEGSHLTLKNGTVVVDRTYTSSTGAVFYINNGSRLTLENMNISEIGDAAFGKNGELLYLGTGSSATIINTVMEANTVNNTNASTIYITTGGASADFQNSTILETVHVTTTGVVTASGATKIAKLNLASTATAQAKADLSGLTEGARVHVAAGETAFTAAFENAENVLSYVRSADVTKKVAVSDNALILVAEEPGDGSAEKPWLITSEADYVEHIFTNTTESGYYKLKADVVLDAAKDDEVNGNQNGSATGRSICIDLDGYTISAVGGNYRFFSCGAEGDLTLKNGTVIVNRTYNNTFGATFNILSGGKLTLENMYVSEIGTVAFGYKGELLCVTSGSVVNAINTVMEADTTNNTSDRTVNIENSEVTFQNSEIRENVYVNAASNVTVSGATVIESMDLTTGACLNAGELTEGAQIGITAAENAPFTGVLENADLYAGYFTTQQEGMKIGVLEDGTLAVVPVGDGSGATVNDPIFIESNEEWIEYLEYEDGVVNTSQQQDWYFVLKTDLRIRTGGYTYGVSGKNVTIDFAGYTMNSANGATARFMRVVNGSLTMKNGTLEENGVSTSHGAVFALEHGELILENMQVDEYSATAYKKRGEIIYATASNITLKNTHITGVFAGAETDYGAIYLREDSASDTPSVLTMVNSSLSCTETGTVGKGGWITAGVNTSVILQNCQISGGAAEMGGNVYVGRGAALTMEGSSISGGTATQGADLYLLGSAVVDAASVTGSMYASADADLEAPSGALVTNMTTGEAVWYATVSEAVAAYTENDSIKLFEAAEFAISCDAVVDLNGKNTTVNGTGDTKVTAYDSANSDYVTYGTLTLNDAVLTNEFETAAIDGNRYYMLTDENNICSFHRLDMEITGVSLRTTTGGIYFKGVWNCDEALKAQIKTFGVAVSLKGMPSSDFAQSADCLWTEFDGEKLENGAEMTGVMIDGIIKKDREPALNDGYGRNYAICATAYVLFENEQTVVADDASVTEDDVAVTLYSVVEGIEAMISALETGKEEDRQLAAKYLQLMDAFYADWKDYGLESWGREDFTEPGN